MAQTKKALEIHQKKQALRDTISELNGELRKAASHVPKSVRGGSYQTAVEWKSQAEKAMLSSNTNGAKRSSVAQLEKLIKKKRAMIKGLTGKK